MEQTEIMKKTFGNLITIYSETGKLLQDIDSMMDAEGWYCDHGNTLGTEQSKNINNPTAWITSYASRYYSLKAGGNLMKCTGVFYLNDKDEPIDPIIVMCSFDMKTKGSGENMGYGYYYIWYAWFSWAAQHNYYTEYSFGNKNNWNFNGGKVMALPLKDVKDQESLKAKVVDPLLAMTVE